MEATYGLKSSALPLFEAYVFFSDNTEERVLPKYFNFKNKTPGTEMRGGRGRLQQQAPSDIRNIAIGECVF